MAGRAQPGATVELLDGSKVVAHVQVDPTGQFALLPPALTPGSHYLTLRAQSAGQSPVGSTQGVAVTVAPTPKTKPLVAMLSPDKPTEVLSDGSAATGSPVAGQPAAPAGVTIQTVEARQGGEFRAAGVAHPGGHCHVYLNGAFLADVTAGPDGHWSVEIKKGMKPGRYTVRADEIEPATGRVTNRAEVPFDYPATVAAGEASPLVPPAPTPAPRIASTGSAAPGGAANPSAPAGSAPAQTATAPAATVDVPEAPRGAAGVVIPDLHTTTVVRGDSLWRISRKMLGHGIKYTEIYASNTSQIRDPKLIYPGQVFVVPNQPAP